MNSLNLNSYRTVIVLGAAQSFGQTAMPIMMLLGGIVGARIAPNPNWATLPIAIMIVGIACATIPAAYLMSRIGRKAGFLIATGVAALAGLMAACSLELADFGLFCLAAFIMGNYAAFMQQFRFAVAESVKTDEVPKCLALLMLAGIVAAILGPEVANRFSYVEGLSLYVGSFLGSSALMAISFFILLIFYENRDVEEAEKSPSSRPLPEIFRQPKLILAVTSALVGYTIMSLIMTATPVSMHEIDQHSLDDTTWVVQSHILAMYVPSFFSGVLITRFGVTRIVQIGFFIMVGCILVGWGDPMLMHYWWSMVLLGIGWNFLFLGGTTLLTQTYQSSERFVVQAVNDFLIFGLQAVGSLGAGILLVVYGWNGVILFSAPWLGLLLIAYLYAQDRETRRAVEL